MQEISKPGNNKRLIAHVAHVHWFFDGGGFGVSFLGHRYVGNALFLMRIAFSPTHTETNLFYLRWGVSGRWCTRFMRFFCLQQWSENGPKKKQNFNSYFWFEVSKIRSQCLISCCVPRNLQFQFGQFPPNQMAYTWQRLFIAPPGGH